MAHKNNIACLVPKLKGKQDYNFWKIQMETHLTSVDLIAQITTELVANPSNVEKKNNSMALAQIHQAIDMSIFGKISTAKTAKQAWDILAKTYQGVDRVQQNKLLMLKRQFELCTMDKSENIETFLSRLTEIKNEMSLNGTELRDVDFVTKVLNSLPMKYDHIVAVIQETKDLATLSIEELSGSLLFHENRISGKVDEVPEKESTEKALQALQIKPTNDKGSGDTSSGAGFGGRG